MVCAACLHGSAARYKLQIFPWLNADMLTELSRREKAANIKPDPDIDVYMKVNQLRKQIMISDYLLPLFFDISGSFSWRAGN